MLPEVYAPPLAPFKHQYEALDAGWDREGYAYLLEMGLGKSRVAIDNFCLLYRQDKVDALLILAPKSVYTNWTRLDPQAPGEVQKWLWPNVKENMRIHAYRAGRAKPDQNARLAVLDAIAPGPRILAINIEAISSTEEAFEFARKFLRAHRVMIVIDESTVIKNPKSVRTKKCLKLAPLASYRRILTGSPSTGSPSDLFAQFEFLGPNRQLLGHRLFSTFRARYCILREMQLPSHPRPILMEVGTQNLNELAEVMAKHSFRRRKQDCLDLPDKVYMKREVELTAEQKKAYEELRKHAMTIIREARADGGDAEVTTQIVITQMMRMHQVVCGHIKSDDGVLIDLPSNRIKELMQVISESEESVVIWCKYRPDAAKVAQALRKEYGEDTVAEWHGGVTQQEREKGEADFQARRKRFMVSTDAGARGRTWTVAQLVVYYSNSHDLEVRQQSEDRTHRIGTTGTVVYVDLFVPGTVDEKIMTALRNKMNIARTVMKEGIEAWI